ncbi:MAG: hypothetical protein EBR82_22440 [Caulobacteraceae bacterium]|nr:hypothetical protein [Caulobacteraceae bacterium]
MKYLTETQIQALSDEELAEDMCLDYIGFGRNEFLERMEARHTEYERRRAAGTRSYESWMELFHQYREDEE